MVAAGVEQTDALRPLRVRGISRLVPVAAIEARIVQLAALDDQTLQGGAAREDGRLVVESETRLGIEPAPVGDVAVLDDDVVAALDPDGADRFRAGVVGAPAPLSVKPRRITYEASIVMQESCWWRTSMVAPRPS